MKGKEQAVDDICLTRRGTYLPGIAEDFHVKWPGDFFQAGMGRSQSPTPPVKKQRRSIYIFDELIFPSSRLAEVYTKIIELCKKYGLWGLPEPTAGTDGFVMSPQVISWQNTIAIDDSDAD